VWCVGGWWGGGGVGARRRGQALSLFFSSALMSISRIQVDQKFCGDSSLAFLLSGYNGVSDIAIKI